MGGRGATTLGRAGIATIAAIKGRLCAPEEDAPCHSNPTAGHASAARALAACVKGAHALNARTRADARRPRATRHSCATRARRPTRQARASRAAHALCACVARAPAPTRHAPRPCSASHPAMTDGGLAASPRRHLGRGSGLRRRPLRGGHGVRGAGLRGLGPSRARRGARGDLRAARRAALPAARARTRRGCVRALGSEVLRCLPLSLHQARTGALALASPT